MIHILIIEDHLESIGPLLDKLEGDSDVKLFYSLENTQEKIEADIQGNLKWKPDVILLDLMLPKKARTLQTHSSGVSILSNIRKGLLNPPIDEETPIVILSGYSEIKTFAQKYDSMVSHIFSKPSSFLEVIRKLKEVALEKADEIKS